MYGHDLRAIIDTAIDQWQQQVPPEQIAQLTTDPAKFFLDYIPTINTRGVPLQQHKA